MDFKSMPFEQFLNSVKKELEKDGLTGTDVIKEAVALWTKMPPEEKQCYVNISSNMNTIKTLKRQQKSSDSPTKYNDPSDGKPKASIVIESKEQNPNSADAVKLESRKGLRRPVIPLSNNRCDILLDSKSENNMSCPNNQSINVSNQTSPQFKLPCKLDSSIDSKRDKEAISQTDLKAESNQELCAEQNSSSSPRHNVALDIQSKSSNQLPNANLSEFKFLVLNSNGKIEKENPFCRSNSLKKDLPESINANSLLSRCPQYKLNSANSYPAPEIKEQNPFLIYRPASPKNGRNSVVLKNMFCELKQQWQQTNAHKFNFTLNEDLMLDSKSEISKQNKYVFLRKPELEPHMKREETNLVPLKSSPNFGLSNNLFNTETDSVRQQNFNLITASSAASVSNVGLKKDCYDFKNLKQILDEVEKNCKTTSATKNKKRRPMRRRYRPLQSGLSKVSVNQRLQKIKMEKQADISPVKIEANNNR